MKKASFDEVSQRSLELVLIADDNPVSQLLLSRFFMLKGIQTDLAKNGVRAVELAKKKCDYGLIIMDLCMPEMDGLSATRIIRSYEAGTPGPRVQIIVISGSGSKASAKECLEAGADAYVAKPISYPQLEATLQRLEVIAPSPI